MEINAVLTFVGIIFQGIIAYLIARLNVKQSAAANKVKDVANTLEKSTKATDEKLTEVSDKIELVGKDVKTVEHATNSMKDALVEATQKSAFAAGRTEERKNPS